MATAAFGDVRWSKGRVVPLSSTGMTESQLEGLIKNDPSILGLGDDIRVIESQRRQQKGRLDLLLEDGAGENRYVVELMLGQLDESHLIRTIEYWDIERRKWTDYQHIAVVVAEDITSRFLNVISLFSGSIPIMAIQVNAIKADSQLPAVVFITVLDCRDLRRAEPQSGDPSDRASWDGWAPTIMPLIDECLKIINGKAKRTRSLRYNQEFVGLTDNGNSNNFMWFAPRKTSLWVVFSYLDAQTWSKRCEDAGLEWKERSDGFRVKVNPANFESFRFLLTEITAEAISSDEQDR